MSSAPRGGLSSVTIREVQLSRLESLQGEIRADVIRPSDADYDRARALFNGAFDRRPQVIVRPLGS